MDDQTLTNVNSPQVSERGKIFFAVTITFIILFAVWTVFVLDQYMGFGLKPHGLRPRTTEGLWGIFTIHFLHGDIKHIWQNTLAFAVLNVFLFYFYSTLAFRVSFILAIVPGILLWTFGRPENHIGLSMFIYGQASFLFVSGLVRDHRTLKAVALIVAFYYGSLVWYLFPIDPHISWEGHLCGAIVGGAVGFALRHKGPQRKKFDWELYPDDESETESEQPDVKPDLPDEKEEPGRITYHYSERKHNSI